MFSVEWIIVYLLLGAFVGFIAGLLGAGGGGIMVPILTSIFIYHGVPVDNVVHMAIGTSMASMIVSSLSSLRAHHANGVVLWSAVKGLAPGIVIGAFLATFIASYLSSIVLAIFFSLFIGLMTCMSSRIFLDKGMVTSDIKEKSSHFFFAGAGIGIISALATVGGGFLTVIYLTWQRLDIKQAIGTSAAVGLPISITGTLGYLVNGWANTSLNNYTLGFVNVPIVLLLWTTSFIAAPYGARCAHALPIPILKKILALLLIILSVKMLSSVFSV